MNVLLGIALSNVTLQPVSLELVLKREERSCMNVRWVMEVGESEVRYFTLLQGARKTEQERQ